MNFISIIILTVIIGSLLSYPRNDKALYEDGPPRLEDRRRRRPLSRPQSPCRGRNVDEGRTFLDWSFQHVNVDYTNNYNINCGGGYGGGGGGGGVGGLGGILGNRPHHQHHGGGLLGGGGQEGGNRPLLGNLGNNGGFLANRPILSNLLSQSQSQSQSQSDNGNGGGFFNPQGITSFFSQLGDGLGSLIPDGSFFNGQGIGSLFDNGLFNGFFGSGTSNNPSPPSPQQPSITRPPQIPLTTSGHEFITTPASNKPIDPDMIYNDERPVFEDHDPVVPDPYAFNRPVPIRPSRYQSYNLRGRSNNIKFE